MSVEYTENLIPIMTSNTSPSGEVLGVYSDDWKAFDRDPSTMNFQGHSHSRTIGYRFPSPVKVCKYTIAIGHNKNVSPRNWTFQGSNVGGADGNWIDLHSMNNITWENFEKKDFYFENNIQYTHYRLKCTQSNRTNTSIYYLFAMVEMMSLIPVIQKHLIKSSNKIQVLSDGAWVDTALSEPLIKSNFEEFGMDDISSIPNEKWEELDEEFEVITWTDEEGEEPKWLEIETDPFSPMERLNQEEEFDVITWTDDKEELPQSVSSVEETVDEGKLFKTTLEDFVAITGVEVN